MKFLTLLIMAFAGFVNSAAGQESNTRGDGVTVTSSSFSYEFGVAEGWQMKVGDSGEFVLTPGDIRKGLESFSIDLLEGSYDSFEGDDAKAKIESMMNSISTSATLAGDFKFAYEDSDNTYRVMVYFWTNAAGNDMATDFILYHENSNIVYCKSTTLKKSRRERSEYILAMMESLKFDN